MRPIQILIIDCGSQYTLVIGRAFRELGVRSAILSPPQAQVWLQANNPKGIILSGGKNSVSDSDAPQPPLEIFRRNIPILGICYGMQWIAATLGGEVSQPDNAREYGNVKITVESDPIFASVGTDEGVWASHGDTVTRLPEGFHTIATSNQGNTIAAIASPDRKIWGLQFHPEVVHTSRGKNMLEQFLFTICECDRDWKPADMVAQIRSEIAEQVGGKKAIIAASGGVDSTTLAAIAAPVLSKRLEAVCIDTGALRESEEKEIIANVTAAAGVKLSIIDESESFYAALKNTADAETKRKRFKRVYTATLNEWISGLHAKYILQGSLATDFIESGATGQAATIKSHHNIGNRFCVPQIHPLKELFKYEVREIARTLGLPPAVCDRLPFPGPGLFIRVIGKPVTPERIALVRWADKVVQDILIKHDLMGSISQLVVGLNCNKFVGVKGDARTYAHAIMIRAVESVDFMTAHGHQFFRDIRSEMTSELTKHPQIVHTFFAEADKPPATTEFE